MNGDWPTNDDGWPVCIECGGLLNFGGQCPNGHRMSEREELEPKEEIEE